MLPEYLSLFSQSGPVKVAVKISGHDGRISQLSMSPNEINKLLSESSEGFISQMTFDGWPFEIYKYEIDPGKNTLTIRARKAQ